MNIYQCKLTISLLLFATISFSQNDNWANVINNGFGYPIQSTVPEMEIFNDTLYISTATLSSNKPARLWRSGDGFNSWEEVTPNQIVADGDNSIHSFGKTDEGGGYFWMGTGNPNNGSRIYQSKNGSDWTPISDPGFGTPELGGAAPNMVVFRDPSDSILYLYAGAGSHGNGNTGEVWRIPYTSTNPADWVKVIDFDTNGKIWFSCVCTRYDSRYVLSSKK